MINQDEIEVSLVNETRFPIGVVCRRTGLNPATVRVWEKRYGAVNPERTASGRRSYSQADLDRLLLLKQALAGGWRISEVAQLTGENLSNLVADDAAATDDSPNDSSRADNSPNHRGEPTFLQFMESAGALDPHGMKSALERAALELSRMELLESFVPSLLRAIGERWSSGDIRPGQEHLATAVTRLWLESLRTGKGSGRSPNRILITTPRGQLHDIGVLLAALSAEEEGWEAISLGADLPAEEIAISAETLKADVVGLSVVYPGADLESEFKRLRGMLDEDVAIFVGGRGAVAFSHLEEIEVRDSLAEFRKELVQLASPRAS